MSKTGKSKTTLLLIAVGIIVVALLYVQNLKSYGVSVSCTNNSILGYGKTSPYLMSVVQPAYCDIQYSVKFNNNLICEGKRSLIQETGVIACEGIEQYDGKELFITTTFYPANSPIISKIDSKYLVFQKNQIR